ncbi:hypothetical protein AAC387_Pa02g1513 [Persea americana]
MPKAKGLQKSLQVCISKLRKSSSQLQLPSNPLSPKNWLLFASKYPRTPSFAVDCHKSNGHDHAATFADIERSLFENFGSHSSDEGHDSYDNDKDHNPNVFTSHFFSCALVDPIQRPVLLLSLIGGKNPVFGAIPIQHV